MDDEFPEEQRKRRLVRASELQNSSSSVEDEIDPFEEQVDDAKIRNQLDEFSDEEEEDDQNTNPMLSFYERERRMLERESDEGEDLFGENMERDYTEMPQLDHYSSSQLDDDTEYAPIPLAERLVIDAQLERRDLETLKRQSRIPDMFLPSSAEDFPFQHKDDDDDETEDGVRKLHFESKRAHRQLLFSGDYDRLDSIPSDAAGGILDEAEEDALFSDLLTTGAVASSVETTRAPYSLKDLISLDSCRRRIARDYRSLLTTFLDAQGHSVYSMRIREMCAMNSESLSVSYLHIAETASLVARILISSPREVLLIMDEVTMRVVLEHFPEYSRIKPELRVRITDLPSIETIRDLRRTHLNGLVRILGVVTRRSSVFPQLKLVKVDCGKCGATLGPFTQDLSVELKVRVCSICDSKGPFRINDSMTVYRNYQRITLQEVPGSVSAGRLPRSKDVILLSDLIDSIRPGDEVDLTGIYAYNYSYQLNAKHGFPVFATVIEANCIQRRGTEGPGRENTLLTEDEIQQIRNLASDPAIGKKIIEAIAPSIYGHENIKMAIALAMFGGVPKSLHHGRIRLRGDINVLLLGDPGTAKSQFLKYVYGVAPRSVYATGQGASAVGLTASVRKDPSTREWTLEGGSLVLADKGVCLIDEFDKMNDTDRTSIHEAMEQQSISISKAGIVTSLQARCSVIAAANPLRGRYNSSVNFSQNVDLSEPILSRFDILCVIKDLIDVENDTRLASFVVTSHARCHPEASNCIIDSGITTAMIPDSINPEGISQAMLRKYISYARFRVSPTLRSSLESEKIARVYAELRKESLATGGIPMTVRHVESMVRMAEAHARMHLRDEVLPVDVNNSIRMMLESFISSQKYAVSKRLQRSFSRYLSAGKDAEHLLIFALQELVRETLAYYQHRYNASPASMPKIISIDKNLFLAKAKELGCGETQHFFKSRTFLGRGFRLCLDGKNAIELDNPLWVERSSP